MRSKRITGVGVPEALTIPMNRPCAEPISLTRPEDESIPLDSSRGRAG